MTTSLWQLLREYKIVIPILQRDFAQGRETGKIPFIRERFLNALYAAIKENTLLELDFVYGFTKENQLGSGEGLKSFVPLDGQQRLTTLFLLHWFIAVREKHFEEAKEYLSNFTYETRHSSRVFCEELVKFEPSDIVSNIKETIINQPWFFAAWKNDPTIKSMLTMLNAIQVKFQNIDNVWPTITSDQPDIVFHLLIMEKLGLSDDLYIKMNSRGKELTEFEYFKSQFSNILTSEQADVFNTKIDQAWSDLFWDLYKDGEEKDIAKLVDNAFLRFFHYVTDIIIFKNHVEIDLSTDDLLTYPKVYESIENVEFLFLCLDVFYSTFSTNPGFFDSLFYIEENDFQENKTRLFFQNPMIDLLKKCADKYDASLRINPFSIGEQLLLFACIDHLIYDSIDFNTRLRKVRNLITNSEDTVRRDNMPALINTVSEIVLNNHIDDNSKFNKGQVEEEGAKQLFIENNSTLKESIHKLEDNNLLQGCIAILNLNDELISYSKAFNQVFTLTDNRYQEYQVISRSLLCFGDYSQRYDRHRRLGNHQDLVWRELFTSPRREDFSKTKVVLHALLSYLIKNPQSNLQEIISEYLSMYDKQLDKPKDWIYYYIKYPGFRRNDNGFYHWPIIEKPYECFMMRRTNFNGFHWSPFLYVLKQKFPIQLSLEDYGAPLLFVMQNISLKITNLNQGFKFEALNEDSIELLKEMRQLDYLDSEDICPILQNESGIDLEDRIEIGSDLISNIMAITLEPISM